MLSLFADLLMPGVTENRDVPSANNLTFDAQPKDKDVDQKEEWTKNRSLGNSSINFYSGNCLIVQKNPCFVLLRDSRRTFSNLSSCLCLKINPLC